MPLELQRGKKYIVHFGPGLVIPGRLGIRINKGEIHVLIESGEAELSSYERKKLHQNSSFKIIPTTAQKANLPDDFAHEVHIDNVLSRVGQGDKAKELLALAKRIITNEGAIFVGHTNTPTEFPISRLEELATRLNLRVNLLVDGAGYSEPPEDHVKVLAQHMGTRFELPTGRKLIDPEYYLAKLTKK